MSLVKNSHIENLLKWLDSQPFTLGAAWEETLENRKREEMTFHDLDREGNRDENPESTANRRFYEAATIVRDYLDLRLSQLAPRMVFLDYACGDARIFQLFHKPAPHLIASYDAGNQGAPAC